MIDVEMFYCTGEVFHDIQVIARQPEPTAEERAVVRLQRAWRSFYYRQDEEQDDDGYSELMARVYTPPEEETPEERKCREEQERRCRDDLAECRRRFFEWNHLAHLVVKGSVANAEEACTTELAYSEC